jgi:hypothetical protein
VWPKPYRLVSAYCFYSADATVANREMKLEVRTLTGQPLLAIPCAGPPLASGGVIVASTQYQLSWTNSGAWQGSGLSSSQGIKCASIPPDLIIWPSMIVRLSAMNQAAGDTVQATVIVIDQEPWRPGFYRPEAAVLHGKPRRNARGAPAIPEGHQ